MNRLALKISEARKAAGLTELELAKKCGLNISYILQVESGKKIVNEATAEKILTVLGTKETFVDEEKAAEQTAVKPAPALKKPERIVVEPTDSWSDALAGVIRAYPILDMASNKAVGSKDLPIINKKVNGYQPDRLMFVKAANDEMAISRIQKGDVLTVLLSKEVQNDTICLLEIAGKKIIRRLRREDNNRLRLSKKVNDSETEVVDLKNVEVIGRVIGNEFPL